MFPNMCDIDRLRSRGEIMTGVGITLKAINSELERRGFHALLVKDEGYFYFYDGEATDWLDRTVRVPRLQSLTLEEWIEQFRVLRERNQKPIGERPHCEERERLLAELKEPIKQAIR